MVTEANSSSSANVVGTVLGNNDNDGGRSTSSNNNNSNGSMMVFAWAGTILINASFVALISWGSFSNWIIGFVCSVLYAAFLLGFGFWLRRYQRRVHSNDYSENDGNQEMMTAEDVQDEYYPQSQSRASTMQDSSSNSLLTSLLFLLAVVAIGVSGSYLPINLSACAKGMNYFSYSGDTTDCVLMMYTNSTGGVPSSVETWWKEDGYNNPNQLSSFAYLPDIDTTLYRGNNGDGEDGLWRVSSDEGKAPEKLSNVSYPRNFLVVGNESDFVCFFAQVDTTSDNYEDTLVCTDGNTVDTTKNGDLNYPRDPTYVDGRIWFRNSDDICYNALYSVDPMNLTDLIIHTTKIKKNEGENYGGEDNTEIFKCSYDQLRIVFVWMLFGSAVPTVVVSFFLGFKMKVPSMAIAGYLSLLWTTICVIFTIDPNFDDVYAFFCWYPVVTSGPWLIFMTIASLTNRMNKNVLVWGINFCALVYLLGMSVLLQVFSEGDYWRWIVLTFVGVFPLIIISLVTNKLFVMVLAALGLMVEAGRLAFYVADSVDVAAGLIVSVVLAVLGIVIGIFGFLLRKYNTNIQNKVNAWADKYLGRWKLPSSSSSSLPTHQNQEHTTDGRENSNEITISIGVDGTNVENKKPLDTAILGIERR